MNHSSVKKTKQCPVSPENFGIFKDFVTGTLLGKMNLCQMLKIKV